MSRRFAAWDVWRRRGGGGVLVVVVGLYDKTAVQSLVAEAERELDKPQGGFESDSSRAISEVKQLIITGSAY